MLTSSKRKDKKRLLSCYCNYFTRKLITQKSLFGTMQKNSVHQIKSLFSKIITLDKYVTVSILFLEVSIPPKCQANQNDYCKNLGYIISISPSSHILVTCAHSTLLYPLHMYYLSSTLTPPLHMLRVETLHMYIYY